MIIAALAASGACAAYAGPCDNARTNEQVALCVAADLKAADDGINASYTRLMATLAEPAKTNLRLAQRQWIRERNVACNAQSKEPDRDKWFAFVLQDFPRAVCVTQMTYRRNAELGTMLATATPDTSVAPVAPAVPTPPVAQKAPAPAGESEFNQRAYDGKRTTLHASGKWYFELRVDYARALAIEPTLIMAGTSGGGHLTGRMMAVRAADTGRQPDVIGFAIDLDNGKLYSSTNGDWGRDTPDSNGGADLKLGRNYAASFLVGAERTPEYLANGAITPNFGDRPLMYAVPAGYRPWRASN